MASRKCGTNSITNSCPVCFERPRYIENGKTLGFCGKTCANYFSLRNSGHGLKKLTDKTVVTSVTDQFRDKWMKNTTPPAVKSVYKVLLPGHVQQKNSEYSKTVANNAKIPLYLHHGKQGMSNANRRFHGTSNLCSIGVEGKTMLCHDTNVLHAKLS